MNNVTDREHLQQARRARAMLSKLSKARDLIQLGAYAAGSDAELDAAIRAQPHLAALLQQDMHHRATLASSREQLMHATA
jgi:flagellum-specific ATP synthase